MSFFNDNPAKDQRRKNRQEYLDSCLIKFSDEVDLQILYDPQIAVLLNVVYWDYVLPAMKLAMRDPLARIDHHKIISGTQCAIMLGSFLRSKETAHIPLHTREAKENSKIREVNAIFAYYIAYDILEQWSNLDITPIHSRTLFTREHVAWLKNVAILNNQGKTHFPFFAISQLWYLAEQLCLAEAEKK